MTTDQILTLPEAMAYVKVGSRSAFHRWLAAFGSKPAINGRYPKLLLDRGIQKESTKRK
jgi:hypothetical protein